MCSGLWCSSEVLHTAVLNTFTPLYVFIGTTKSLTGFEFQLQEDAGLVRWYLDFTEGWGMVRNSCLLLSWVCVVSTQLLTGPGCE